MCCVSEAATEEHRRDSEEANEAVATVRSSLFQSSVSLLMSLTVPETQLTLLSALQDSRAEDGGESAGASLLLFNGINVN